MTVLALPPRESWSRRVSLESLYGTWVLFPSTRAEMTFPSAERDRLILAASFSRLPFAPVLLWRSLPARSTMLSFPTRMWSSPSERELRSFMLVNPTDLDWLPISQGTTTSPGTSGSEFWIFV
uniref:Uncharacterized protein n=1 Tax=Sparus aurata TaxID=8175 RepID=A0A671Z233_SPAAU